MFTIRPEPRPTMCSSAGLVMYKAPFRLTWITFSQSSADIFSTSMSFVMPA